MKSVIACAIALLSASALAAPAPRPDNHPTAVVGEKPPITTGVYTAPQPPFTTGVPTTPQPPVVQPGKYSNSTVPPPTAPPAVDEPIVFPPVTFSVADDLSGANAAATILANGVPALAEELFLNSAIDVGGAIVGTSVQLINFPPNVRCVLNNADGTNVAIFNFQQTFAEIDGVAGAAVPVDITGKVFQCEV